MRARALRSQSGGRGPRLRLRPAPIRYASLTRPVRIPVEGVAAAWQPVPFVAESMLRARRVLISGVLFRTDTAAERAVRHLSARAVPGRSRDRRGAPGADDRPDGRHIRSSSAVATSACSTPRRKARDVSGETPRGLFRFRIAACQRRHGGNHRDRRSCTI